MTNLYDKAIIDTVKPNPNIKITGEVPANVSLRIRLGCEERILDSLSGQVGFAVDKPGKYSLEIAEEPASWEQQKTNEKHSWTDRITYGIVCAVNAWGVRGKWERDVRAHAIKGNFEVELVDTIEAVVMYQPSEYREVQKGWVRPSLNVVPAVMTEIQIDSNPSDFTNKLNDYIVGLRILAAPGIIFFGLIALHAMLTGAGTVAITFGALTAVMMAAIIGMTRSQRDKCRRLLKIL